MRQKRDLMKATMGVKCRNGTLGAASFPELPQPLITQDWGQADGRLPDA